MSLAAVPAFFLARRVVRDGLALLAALMTIAIPSMAYTGTVMTENAFYPLFLVVALVLVLVLERPTPLLVVAAPRARRPRVRDPRADGGDRGGGAPRAARARGVRRARRLGATISRFRWLYGIVAGASALVVLLLQIASGNLLGAYSAVGDRSYDAERGAPVPLVARRRALALRPRDPARGDHRPRRACPLARRAAAGVPRRDRRADRLHRPRRRDVRVGVLRPDRGAEHVLRRAAPLHRAARVDRARRAAPAPARRARCRRLRAPRRRDSRSTGSSPRPRSRTRSCCSRSGRSRTGSARTGSRSRRSALAVALAAAFLFVPRRYALALPLLVLGLWILAIRPIWWGTHGFERFSRGALFQGIRTADRDWVDTALPSGERAAFLWTGRTDRLTVNQNEFFNRGVGPVYYVTDPTPGGLARDARADRSADGRGDASRRRRRFATASSSPTPRSSRTGARSRRTRGGASRSGACARRSSRR